MYAYIIDKIVREVIPDIDPIFPGIDINERYPADMLANIQATNLETLRRSAGLRPDDAIDQLIPDRDAARKLFNESDTTRKIIT